MDLFSPDERQASIFGSGATWDGSKISKKVVIDGNTEVCLVHKGVARYGVAVVCFVGYHSLTVWTFQTNLFHSIPTGLTLPKVNLTINRKRPILICQTKNKGVTIQIRADSSFSCILKEVYGLRIL